MSSLLSERPVDLAEAGTAESDSDSGMGSPVEEPVIDTNMVIEDQQDSDEDITVSRKGRSRKALQDSDSDGEQEEAGMANALVLSESSDEETKTKEPESIKRKRGKRVSHISMDSDESEPEKVEVQVKPKEAKKREKSQRHKEKEKRNVALVKRLKEKTEEALPIKALNDSGCLLGDSDLFDAQLEEDSEPQLEGEEEESLDAIRSAVKKKAKQKPHLSEFSGDEEQENRSPRKERKAAKASKQALKELHSESQRLVRESMLNLPYYMPEPKSIDQFFKKKPRPEGRAMALLKSAKYQACILERTTQPPSDQTTRSQHMPEQDSSPPTESSLGNQSSTTSLPLEDTATGTHQDNPTNDSNPQTSSKADVEHDISTDEPKPVGQEKETPIEQETEGAKHSDKDQEEQQVSVDQTQTAAQMLKPRKDKLARLRELGLDPPPVAKLCADDGAFVQLEPPQENPALKALQERFMKHIQPAPRPKRERTLQLNVVRKDSAPSGQEELRSESITITVNEGEDEPANVKPGEKLVLLKSRLQQAMAIRRKEERERRAALHRLDNEDCEEEEEAEMTESEDEEGVDELLGGGGDDEVEEGEEAVDKEEDEVSVKTCPSPGFKSPSPTPADTDGTLMLFAGNSCSRTGDGVRRLGPAGHEADNKMEEDDTLSLAKDSSHNSSFELMGSMIPSYQPVNRAAGRGLSNSAFRSPSPCLFRSSFLGSASKSSGKMSEPSLSLPVEDSQDLYAPSSPSESALPSAGDSQGRFSLEEDTHSQLLDADGFLNVGPRGVPSRSHKRQLILDSLDENAMDANMGELLGLCSGGFGTGQTQPGASPPAAEDELLGLCSGAFSTQPEEPVVKPREKNKTIEPEVQRGESQGSSETDMDQLLALCSGKFTGSPSASSLQSVSSPAFEKPSEMNRNKNIIEEEEEGDCEFRLLSDVDSLSEKDENEDKSDAEEEETENEEEEEQEEEREAVFGRRTGKKKIRLAEFVESEAELSGSDVGSEDEDDGGGDEYEEEEIQEDLPSDEELMDQVNKIHMKQVLDDDKRRLRLYQERYLADGDLHSDGPGRARRFRWKNIDDNFEFGGMGPDGDEEEEDEEIDQLELQRRKERLEREQWLREQTEAQAKKGEDADDEEKIEEEDSQFMKLAKKLTAKTLQKKDPSAAPLQEKAAPNTNQFRKPFQPAVVKRGSLLSQPPAMLQKLASISDSNPLAPRNSRGFLFQTLSPEKEPSASEGPRKQIKKRGQMDSFSPAAKRPCLGSSLKPTGPPRSIFSYLEN
ncbi:claspin-like isoform X1 [Sinocyclocheilus rhinocerous]|uniref:claspin-like isoform X1 n=2 Tax=Sinocyclocheilus rhinocerous TaxID=307959 RepID=UPI0007BA031D|nr:PREDICTED: claspin-like isoform X1 [Sinocyclocheilus rhinocerous]